ncbi:hypothetical protein BD779DRAFT_1465286 [Infundibulicybe gibba]|nr:hypothetical protein BD779DRAFT_1465286 [Infundibulicybe gibba]
MTIKKSGPPVPLRGVADVSIQTACGDEYLSRPELAGGDKREQRGRARMNSLCTLLRHAGIPLRVENMVMEVAGIGSEVEAYHILVPPRGSVWTPLRGPRWASKISQKLEPVRDRLGWYQALLGYEALDWQRASAVEGVDNAHNEYYNPMSRYLQRGSTMHVEYLLRRASGQPNCIGDATRGPVPLRWNWECVHGPPSAPTRGGPEYAEKKGREWCLHLIGG